MGLARHTVCKQCVMVVELGLVKDKQIEIDEAPGRNISFIRPFFLFFVSYSPFSQSACLLQTYHVFTNNNELGAWICVGDLHIALRGVSAVSQNSQDLVYAKLQNQLATKYLNGVAWCTYRPEKFNNREPGCLC